MKAKAQPRPEIVVPTAREMLSALGAHINQLHPEVNANPKKKQISATRATATAVNSAMTVVRTSVQAAKISGNLPKLKFLDL